MPFLSLVLAGWLVTACSCLDTNVIEVSCIKYNVVLRNLSAVGCEIESLPKDIFESFTELKILDLRKNVLTELTNSNFQYLESLTTLDLSENNLTSLPDDFLHYMPLLEELYVIDNPLGELSDKALRGSNLTRLHIENNAVPLLLASRALGDMSKLTYVILINCGITTLPGDLFEGSNDVNYINLKQNRIKHLLPNLLANKFSLTSLLLYENQLSELSPALFADLHKVWWLDFDNNEISEIYAGTFSSLNNLSKLSLRCNKLRMVSPDAFPRSLRYLSLGSNKLTTLETELLPELIELSIDDNSLTSVPQSWPKTYPDLESLFLYQNAFTRLSESDMAVLSNFPKRNAYFDFNKIETILIYKNATKISKLWLDGTPLRCDCLMYNFANHLYNNLSSVANAYCTEPKSLNGKKLEDVPLKDFICPFESCPDSCECVVRPATKTLEASCKKTLTTEDFAELDNLRLKHDIAEKTLVNYNT